MVRIHLNRENFALNPPRYDFAFISVPPLLPFFLISLISRRTASSCFAIRVFTLNMKWFPNPGTTGTAAGEMGDGMGRAEADLPF